MKMQPRFRAAMDGLCAGFALCLLGTSTVLLEAQARAATMGIFDPASFSTADGRQIYEHICQGCHMPDAQGAVGAGRFPALAKDPALVSPQFMALRILMGRGNMPAFGAKHAIGFPGPPTVLNAAQIAAVTNYVRTHFGNHYTDSITAEAVGALDP